MHLSEVIELFRFQQIFPFLQFATDDNEELIKLFYVGIQRDFVGFTFEYNINNRIMKVDSNVWKEFG